MEKDIISNFICCEVCEGYFFPESQSHTCCCEKCQNIYNEIEKENNED
jgi:hypothetical protein